MNMKKVYFIIFTIVLGFSSFYVQADALENVTYHKAGRNCICCQGLDKESPLRYLMYIKDYKIEFNEQENLASLDCKDFKEVPMDENIRIVLYKPEGSMDSKDILDKIRLKEVEMNLTVESQIAPYYNQSKLKNYYPAKLK